MASIFTHAFVAYGTTTVFNECSLWKRVLFFAVCLSILPDADVIGFLIGVSYGDPWGHRGATHSIVFSLAMAALITALFFRAYFDRKYKLFAVFMILFLSAMSHGILDAWTNGGLGVAFFWPFDNTRYFFPYHPVQVSPIGISAVFSEYGLKVILSELIFIILPTTVFIVVRKIMAKKRNKRRAEWSISEGMKTRSDDD